MLIQHTFRIRIPVVFAIVVVLASGDGYFVRVFF